MSTSITEAVMNSENGFGRKIKAYSWNTSRASDDAYAFVRDQIIFGQFVNEDQGCPLFTVEFRAGCLVPNLCIGSDCAGYVDDAGFLKMAAFLARRAEDHAQVRPCEVADFLKSMAYQPMADLINRRAEEKRRVDKAVSDMFMASGVENAEPTLKVVIQNDLSKGAE